MGTTRVETNILSELRPSGSGFGSRCTNGRQRRWTIFLALLLLGAACARATTPTGSPNPSDSPLSLPALELAVLEAVGGDLVYCDPDQYPVAHGTPLENARGRLPTIQADRAAYDAILHHEGLSAGQKFTSDELIAINDDYKQMQAIKLAPAGLGYAFDLLVPQKGSDVRIWRLNGTASPAGVVTISHREVGQRPSCPVCLAAGVRIATPEGEIPVEDLRIGMAVWTTDLHGQRIAGVVLETGHMEAPLGHEVVRMSLADGRAVVASPGHPTADGRTIGELMPGDRYGGIVVTGVSIAPYAGSTWDLLPSGPTGTYFANGVLLVSTLTRA
jgi:hypothetical protein